MRRIQTILLFVLFFGLSASSFGQLDPLYNQYLFNQSMINPAYTGINNVLSASAISRVQWAGFDGAPFTNTLNLSSTFVDNRVGVGLLLISDQFGVNNNSEMHMMYSYKLDLTPYATLSFGIQAGLMSYRHDFSKINQRQDLSDPDLIATDDFQKANFGTGLFLKGEDYFFGVSIPRIKNIDIANTNGDLITRYFKHVYVSGGYIFNKGSMLAFKPSILLKIVDGNRSAVDVNAHLFINETLWVGTTIRNLESMGINGQINVGDQLRLGYAFGFPLNSLRSALRGTTHEFMVIYEFQLFDSHYQEKRYF